MNESINRPLLLLWPTLIALQFSPHIHFFKTIFGRHDFLVLGLQYQHPNYGVSDQCHCRIIAQCFLCSLVSYHTLCILSVPYHYLLSIWQKERCTEIKDIGVWFGTKLSFNKHLHQTILAANKMLGISRDFINIETFKFLVDISFFLYVLSKLEYASLIWHPIYKISSISLEAV